MNKVISPISFIVIGFLIFWLIQKSCNSNALVNNVADSIRIATAAISNVKKQISFYKDSALHAEAMALQASQAADEANRIIEQQKHLLSISDRNVTALSNKLADLQIKKDTTEKGKTCYQLDSAFTVYRYQANTTIKLFDKALDSSKKANEYLGQQISFTRRALSACESGLDSARAGLISAKKILPKRALYYGIEGFSTAKAFQSLNFGILYKDLKGQQWKLSTGATLSGDLLLGGGYYRQF